MRYNTVPDNNYEAINREIDKYSSSLFMCSTRLLMAEDEWMDTGIAGILVFVTCRKLKSNVIRIYDSTTTRLLFEFELYEGIQDTCVYGTKFIMIPFKRFCFCLLFENEDDSLQSKKKIIEMASLYKNIIPIPDQAMLQMKRAPKIKTIEISRIQDFRIKEHNFAKMDIAGDDVYDVLYKSQASNVALKKKVLKPALSQEQPNTSISSTEREIDEMRKKVEAHQFDMNILSNTEDTLPPPIPQIPEPSEINRLRPSDIMFRQPVISPPSGPIRLTKDRSPGSQSGYNSIDTIDMENLTLEKQNLRDNINEDFLRELIDNDDTFMEEVDRITTMHYNRCVSDASEMPSGVCVSNVMERNRQRVEYDDLNEDYNRNVLALRQYQRENSQWGDEIKEEEDELHQSQGEHSTNVYVIDDADMMLREEPQDQFENFRPSNCTIISNNRVSSYMPSFHRPRTVMPPKQYPKCSKESLMIMQDLDNLVECSEESMYMSQEERVSSNPPSRSSYNTVILPSVLSHSSYRNSVNSNDSSEIPRPSFITQSKPKGNGLPPHISPYKRSFPVSSNKQY